VGHAGGGGGEKEAMVARATAKSWFNLIAGLVVATQGAAAAGVWAGEGAAHDDLQVAQTGNWGRSARARAALNSAIDCQRHGDYEAAAGFLQEAQARQDDLTPQDREDLARMAQANAQALQARREGTDLLTRAERALQSGHGQDAVEAVKQAATREQYLAPQDKVRLIRLSGQLRLRTTMPPAEPTAALANQARGKVIQGRAMLNQGNWDGAEAIAHEVQQTGVQFGTAEDSPTQILKDIDVLRHDPKALLATARAALTQGDVDRAEALARQAEQIGGWSLNPFADTPAKVLKEVAAARARGVGRADRNTAHKEVVGNGQAGAQQGVGQRPGAGGIGDDTDQVRAILQEGRKALREGNFDLARRWAEHARTFRANLQPNEDSSERLLADVARADGRGIAPRTDAPAATASTGGPAGGAAARTKEEAQELLQQGRNYLLKGAINEAGQCGQRARACTTARWGLFEDSPDSLLTDVEKARTIRNKEESAQLLSQGRRLLEQGDYSGAEKAAYQAQALHVNYSIWDPFGDRPSKLLADAQHARQTNPRPQPPAGDNRAATEWGPRQAGSSSAPAAEGRARQMLSEARIALQNNDPARARQLADQVRDMHVQLTSVDDSPDAICRALAARSTGGAIGAMRDHGTMDAAGVTARVPGREMQSGRERALVLMAEARQGLRENRLIEARIKVIEASKTGALFHSDEESPEALYQQIAARARQQVDALMSRSLETLRYGAGDSQSRLQKAEQDLRQARQLTEAFGQDVQPVDQALAMLQQLRGGPAGALPMPNKERVATLPEPLVQPPLPPGATAEGMRKLEDARLELQHGATGNARRIAEEVAGNPRLGMRNEALAVLRSVEAEEANQRRLRACRIFDAAWSCFLKHDYPQSSRLIAAIDVSMLDDVRKGRLREAMSAPEMQPNARGQVVQAGGPSAADSAATPPSVLPPGAGRAHAADESEALLKRSQAMREVKFQALRKEGMQLQTDAMDKFRSGQAEEAIIMLQDYVYHLQEEQLDPGKLTLLRRPVESRIAQLKLLKAQEEFANRGSAKAGAKAIEQVQLAERTKQKNVGELMKQFNTLYKEGKYLDAESMAMRAHELDPDNQVITAAVQLSHRHRAHDEFDKIKENRAELNRQALNGGEDEGDPDVIRSGMVFAQDHADRMRNREKNPGGAIVPPRRNDNEREIDRQLKTPVTLNFKDAPLRAVLEDLRVWKGINIFVDESALQEEGISIDRPVTVSLERISLQSALNLLLKNIHLTYVIKDEVLQITTRSRAKGSLVRAMYPVHDLVLPVENFGTVGDGRMPWEVAQASQPPAVPPTPVTGAMTLTQGAAVGMPSGSPGSAASNTNSGPFASSPGGGSSTVTPQVTVRNGQTNEEVLINVIQSTVEPRSWADMGGAGTINYFPNTMALVINQTPDIQDQISELLDALRRLQDQEVVVEIRFISVTEDFFERIGVNFNLNIVNPQTAAVQEQLVSGVFKPDDLINSFTPKNFLSGLQASGTFTPDLNIPLNVNTFAQSLPPFGGYPGVPGYGGITMGLAFLSDIQVFLFMEAVQGDRRTNVMQAPKLSMFNGQTATLTVNDTQFLLTGVNVTPQLGIFTYSPQVQRFPFGVNLTMNAVITADRRFVRMSLNPSLTNLSTPEIDLFPVVVPIFPQFDGTFTGNPVVFTQFLQMPRISTVTVATTVAVPDGGTVLMGGLKRLQEGRTEYGPPVLSKIPFINRLFKNVGYGKSTESLLIMVTPRIIIQEEEEAKQTGYIRQPRVVP
jgi:type II secretory pathway component GspD/PulD (secretin)